MDWFLYDNDLRHEKVKWLYLDNLQHYIYDNWYQIYKSFSPHLDD